MRTKLFELYTSKQEEFNAIKTQITDAAANGPFLMSPNKQYIQQPTRLLIIGQETNGWENYSDLKQQMSVYEGFNLGSHYRPSPFWNIIRKVEQGLSNAAYSCAWTNISKFDINNERPVGEHEKIISKMDYILKDEIDILDPKFCMFFTSHSFDFRLRKIFPGIQFLEVPGFEKKNLCRLQHEKLPAHSYRTYHPKYLRIRSYENKFIEFIKTVQQKEQ